MSIEGEAHSADDPPDALTQTVAREESARLHAALAHLPPPQRQALVLAYGAGLTTVEVSHLTGTPLGTVKGRLRLGQASIARRLGPGHEMNAPGAA